MSKEDFSKIGAAASKKNNPSLPVNLVISLAKASDVSGPVAITVNPSGISSISSFIISTFG